MDVQVGIGAINLTEVARKKLFKLLIFLNIIQFILGSCSLVIASYFYTTIARNLHKSNKLYSSMSVLYILSMGLMTVMLSIFGVKMSYNCSSKPLMRKINSFHNLWIAFSIISVLLVFSFLFTLNKILDTMLHLIMDTFWHGISHYISDSSWKKTFDYFQTSFKCCGINTYTDWYETPWIPLSYLPQDASTLSRFGRADGQVLFPIVPSSCCRKNIIGSKCNTEVLEKLKSYIQPIPVSELYTTGCIQLITDRFSFIIKSTALICILIILFQSSIAICGHYLYTSTRNSLLMGIPNEAAPGWLFGRGDFGYHGGKTLIVDHVEGPNIDEENKPKLKIKRSHRKWNVLKKRLPNRLHKKFKIKHHLDSSLLPVKERLQNKLAKFRHNKNSSNTEKIDLLESKDSNIIKKGQIHSDRQEKSLIFTANDSETSIKDNFETKNEPNILCDEDDKHNGLHLSQNEHHRNYQKSLNPSVKERCKKYHRNELSNHSDIKLNEITNNNKQYEKNSNFNKTPPNAENFSEILYNLEIS